MSYDENNNPVVVKDVGFLKPVLFSLLKLIHFQSKLEKVELNAGSDISCLKASPFNNQDGKVLIATGGKENDLKVWDLNDLSEKKDPMFKAKNLPDNWVLLREPVWVMSIDFLDANRVVVGTAHNQVTIKKGISFYRVYLLVFILIE